MTDEYRCRKMTPAGIRSPRSFGWQFAVAAIAFLIANSAQLGDAFAANRVALVIGNSQYAHVSPLVNPENDAKLVASTLRKQGFDVLEYTNLGFKAMLRAFAEFTTKLQAAGRDTDGFIFYAGHGMQVGGLNFIIPVDALIKKAADVEIEAVSATSLMRSINHVGNRLNIIVLDACRNNPYRSLFRSASRGLARMDAPIGSLVAFSTAPGMVAADGSGKNSPYTAALAKAIATPGLKVEDVFKRARNEVYQVTNGAQVPWESSSIFDDFYFSQEAAPTAVAAAPKSTAAIEKPSALRSDESATVWNTIQNTNSRGILEAFIKRFPTSLYADFAKARLAEIKERPTSKTRVGKTKIAVARPPNPIVAEPSIKAPAKPDKRLRAVLAEGGEPLAKGLRWDVYDAKANAEGKRKHITYTHDAQPNFKLKDGRYYITAAHGNARASGEIVVRSADQWGRLFVLNAGRLNLTASFTEKSDALKSGLRFDVYHAKLDEDDKRKHVTYSHDWRSKFVLPSGRYYVTVGYGNARAAGELDISPGQLLKQKLVLKAGRLSLTASLAQGGADEKKGLRWDIYGAETDEDGKRKHITYSHDWRAKFVLPAGRYYVTAIKENSSVNTELDIAAAKLTKQKLVLNAGLFSLTATLSEGGDVQKQGLRWDIYGAETDEDGKRRHITYSHDWRSKFYLPAGRYYVTVNKGNASVANELDIGAGKLAKHNFVLNAGLLTLTASLVKGSEMLKSGLRWDIYGAETDEDGKRRHITYSHDWRSKFYLPAGRYYVTARHGNAAAAGELVIDAGKNTNNAMPLNAGKIKFVALAKGGAAIAKGLRWDIYDAKKNLEGKRRHVTYSHDAQPLFTLNRGAYAIFVTYGKVRKEFALTVQSGDSKKVDIAVAP